MQKKTPRDPKTPPGAKPPMQAPPAPPAPDEKAEFFDHETGAFFRRVDWLSFWTALIVSLGAYVYTLAPTVTLEDSGELAVASDYMGVPHPPGYPIWSLVTWFFQWVFHWVKYYGQPNPAWSVGLMSAFFGALACGALAMLISRSGADMLRSLRRTTEVLGYGTENLICWAGGVTGGLLFAFSSVLWSQSVIVEVYSLNAFFMVIILLLTYWWICRPKEDRLLYITAFLLGLGLTNHQALVFVAPMLLAAIWFRDRALFRDCLAALLVCVAGYLFWKASLMKGNLPPEAIRSKQILTSFGFVLLVAPVGLFLIERKLMTEWKRVLLVAGMAVLGLSFYAYMPFSSEQNPPINWGYPRTIEGFKHAIGRGQYEKIDPIVNFKHALSHPGHFLALLNAIVFDPQDYTSVVAQFTWYLSILVIPLIPFFFRTNARARHWVVTTLICFLSLTVLFIVFQYPQLDVQTLFIGRVQYIQAHAIFALWIAYGLVFLLAWLETLLGGVGVAKTVGVAAALLLPSVLVFRNAYDDKYIKIVGGVEQNGHDFGWQFGNWQLRGINGISNDFRYGRTDEEFAQLWAEYPTPGYPPEMETNAIFFGGTDPGRFVPTYMIYCAKVRPDTFLITQNALADNTYMSVMRDLYGDVIWIPSQQDSNFAFQKYVEDVQAGRIPPGADVQFENGRVSVQGVQGVMMINGILARMIFEANKHKHAFYVEESYVIPWMYNYLEPHGLIMKINKDPLPGLTPEMVSNDRKFWDWHSRNLIGTITNVPLDFKPDVPRGTRVEVLDRDPQAGTQRLRIGGNPKFLRDVVARKTFSKLRGAIAGIYVFRRMFPEAEYAFRQAIDLYPLSPEANFRLADVFMQQRRFTDARRLIEMFLKEDPGNDKVAEFLKQIKDTEAADTRRIELEGQFSQGRGELNAALELASLYRRLNLEGQFLSITRSILGDTNIPPNYYLEVAKMFADMKRLDLLAYAFQRYLEREPQNAGVWVDLAAVQTAMQQTNEAVQSVRRAVEIGGEAIRDVVRKDRRFDPVRDLPEFKAVVPPIQSGLPARLPDLPLF